MGPGLLANLGTPAPVNCRSHSIDATNIGERNDTAAEPGADLPRAVNPGKRDKQVDELV